MATLQKPIVLVLGANGQIGRFVVQQLDQTPGHRTLRRVELGGPAREGKRRSNEVSPSRMSLDRHSCLIERTHRSARG
jgi:nucleoside-diphosphate-sugar epimerase